MQWQPIIAFWFKELKPRQWFVQDDTLDQLIRQRFEHLLLEAKMRRLAHWRAQPRGRLAEIILLDQFSRHIYRKTPKAYAADDFALNLTLDAIRSGDDRGLTRQERVFLYRPLLHSESASVHDVALQVFANLGTGACLEFERRHKAIIDRFGRFPQRNEILGRKSTPEELAFLRGDAPLVEQSCASCMACDKAGSRCQPNDTESSLEMRKRILTVQEKLTTQEKRTGSDQNDRLSLARQKLSAALSG